MREQVYTVTADDPVVIYGAGERGQSIAKNMSEKGYNVIGYIDRRATQSEMCGCLPVWSCEPENIRDYVLVISLQDGMKHREVAEYYFRRGITKIMMLPMNLQISICQRRLYRESYFAVVNGCIDELLQIPLYSSGQIKRPLIIDWKEATVAFWCPIKHIYMRRSITSSFHDRLPMSELPYHMIKEYYDLMLFLDGDETINISAYLSWQSAITSEEQEIFLRNRREWFALCNEALKYDMGFFTDAPSYGVWDTGGFVLPDGNHRSSFLAYRGYRKVPIYVSEKDFIKYLGYIER